jgi:glycosyltransferase involved in cell wall biosynthesis
MKVLIISDGFPGYGGQATTAHNLHLFLESKNFETKLLFLNEDKALEGVNSKENKNSDNLNISHGFLKQTKKILLLINTKISISKPLRSSFIVLALKFMIRTRRYYLIDRRIKSYIKRNNFHPDLVITNSPYLYANIHKLFDKTLVIIGNSMPIHRSPNKEINAQQIIENTTLIDYKLPKYLVNNLNKSNVVFNSKLTQNIYELYGVNPINSAFLFLNFAPYVIKKDKAFIDRKYDIAFIASNFSRKIKNPELAYKLFERFPELNKIAIGKESDYFSEITNTDTMNLMSQKEIAKILSETKLLIISSYFDSSPSVTSEALLNGCNILLSKNVGWHETIDDRCVVKDFQNHDEWVSKIEYLVDNEIKNNQFLDIINNSKEEISSLIVSLI